MIYIKESNLIESNTMGNLCNISWGLDTSNTIMICNKIMHKQLL